eukprot:1092014-Rhodomonas_salina.1
MGVGQTVANAVGNSNVNRRNGSVTSRRVKSLAMRIKHGGFCKQDGDTRDASRQAHWSTISLVLAGICSGGRGAAGGEKRRIVAA